MTTTTAPIEPPLAAAADFDRGLVIRFDRVPWEGIAYFVVFAVAMAMRLWDLDARAYHYDETIHAYDSWNIFANGPDRYIHSPWSHGPFLYLISAFGIFLFGDNLVSPRMFPALFGAALVLMPWLLRSKLGVWGALAAAVLIAFSPSILYFSRFIRADIFSLVFDFGLIIAMWRYFESRQTKWLVLGGLALVLTFSTKETSFITLGTVASFLVAWLIAGWRRQPKAPPVDEADEHADQTDGESVATPQPKPSLRERIQSLSPQAGFLLFMLALTLPFFASVFGTAIDQLPFGLTTVETNTDLPAGRVGAPDGSVANYVAAGVITGALFLVSAVVGYLWRGRLWLVILAMFWTIFFLLHTTFLNNMVGMGTGVWQSLGYWIAQQGVERGNQPWYYYFIQLSIYEFLPVLFALGAMAVYAARVGLRFVLWTLLIALIAGIIAGVIYNVTGGKGLYIPLGAGLFAVMVLALRKGDPFDWFLVHWSLVSVFLYVVAGEKMPWLLTHMALPFALLGGKAIGGLLSSIPWSRVVRSSAIVLVFAAPLLALALYALAASVPWGIDPIGAWSFFGALAFTFALMAAAWFIGVSHGWMRTGQMLGVSILALMAVFTVRAGVQATYANDDNPKEMLLYSQISSEVPRVAEQVEQLALESGKGREEITILVDTANAAFAPWRWYFRNYERVDYRDMTSSSLTIDHDVVILSGPNRQKIGTARDRYEEGKDLVFNQWFNPWVYQGYTAGTFLDDVRSGTAWNTALRFFAYREMQTPPATDQGVVFFAKDVS